MTEIFIYDELGPSWMGLISAEAVVTELHDHDDFLELTVRINSPGGDVSDGLAIYNALSRRTGQTTVEVDGIAASAASLIAMAGDTIRIAENAMLMIHSPWTIAAGNAEELRQTAGVLDKFESGLIDTYAKRTGNDRDTVAGWMAAETWFDAHEAVVHGFADEIGQPLTVAASVRPGQFKNVPRGLRVTNKPRRQTSLNSPVTVARQIETRRRRAGL